MLSAACAFILAIPSVVNFAAYLAITSIATIGLYVSYGLPILLRLRVREFQRGPWHLGQWSKPIGIIAVVWVVFISVLFMLPPLYPITWVTFNYTPVVVLGTLVILVVWWMVSVRHWFKGPHVQGSAAELSEIEKSVGETTVVDDIGLEGSVGD
jgi:amino acid transporter